MRVVYQASPTGWYAEYRSTEHFARVPIEAWVDGVAMTVDTAAARLVPAQGQPHFVGLTHLPQFIGAVPAEPGWQATYRDGVDGPVNAAPVVAWVVDSVGEAYAAVAGGTMVGVIDPDFYDDVTLIPPFPEPHGGS